MQMNVSQCVDSVKARVSNHVCRSTPLPPHTPTTPSPLPHPHPHHTYTPPLTPPNSIVPKREKWGKLDKAEMTIMEGLILLDQIIDESDPDVSPVPPLSVYF